MKYSRTKDGPRYVTATAVVMAEVIKLIISLLIYLRQEARYNSFTFRGLYKDVFGPASGWKGIFVPAVLYFIQNNLQYVAVTLLDAATFQVTYQLKIITTALFSVALLKKQLFKVQWVAVGLLTIGIAIVQLPTNSGSNDDKSISNKVLGLISVLTACVLSGLAGVW
jgi:solute carrier family 35 (UDP-sugar transporter), member A1/2/3